MFSRILISANTITVFRPIVITVQGVDMIFLDQKLLKDLNDKNNVSLQSLTIGEWLALFCILSRVAFNTFFFGIRTNQVEVAITILSGMIEMLQKDLRPVPLSRGLYNLEL